MINFTLYANRTGNLLRLKSSEKLFNLLISLRSPWQYYHCVRVSAYASILANSIGLSKKQTRHLQIAGVVHDIGFTAINDRILDKQSSLTTEEYTRVKHHPVLGMRILDCYDFPEDIVKGVVQHHEAFDGSGYPVGLKGEAIGIYGRILFIAEAFDTMTNDTPYTHAYTIDAAMKSIQDMSNKKYDPDLVHAMLDSEELTDFYMQRDKICRHAVQSAFQANDLFTL